MNALGMIEVYGYLTAVTALDTALKAANVHLVDVIKVRGGLVSVLITGDVGAVQAAIEASSVEAKRVGKIICVHVIPRPDKSIETLVCVGKSSPQKIEIKENFLQEELKQKENSDIEDIPMITEKSLKDMTVVKLRNLARQLKVTSMTRNEIKFANKSQLIQAISSFLEQER